MTLTISVVICTRNRLDDFRETLASLLKQKRLPDELVVVDSSDTPALEEYLKTISPPMAVKYIHSAPGLTLQRNVGVRNSGGDVICFFDDDTELNENYLHKVEAVFARNDPGLGAVGGRLENLFGDQPMTLRFRVERAVFGLIRIIFGLDDYGSGRFRPSGMATFPHHLTKPRYIDCLSGGLMSFRREVFQKMQFDEGLPGYGLMEDWSISKSLMDAGYKAYYEPAASLIHKESPQNRFDYSRWAEMYVVNYDYLFRKYWRRDWRRIPFYYWALIGFFAVNFHSRDALRGAFSGLKKVLNK
ncbi:MAG: glycosyltransferase family 2 protein [Chloroflexi bacterium CFX2]|nr:glycosyltransferase family 2 protein [Chloroflexi bacterium CFX2]